MERKEALRRVLFLKTLPDAVVSTIAAAGKVLSLRKGEVLFAENTKCIGLLVVLTGAVRIYKVDNRGRELTVGLEEPGSSVGEVPLFDGGNYPANAEAAAENTTVFVVSRDQFQQVMLAHPQIALQALRTLSVRLRKQLHIIEAQSLHTVRARLAYYLLDTSNGRATFPLEETNEAIGSHIGSVREVVSRTLSILKDAGFVRIDGRQVTILEGEALRLVATSDEDR